MRHDIAKSWRRALRAVAVAVAASLAVGACASLEEVGRIAASPFAGDAATTGCKRISAKARAKINWARVPVREIAVRNGEYAPMIFRLTQGRPYVLRLRNRDLDGRTFVAPEFFRHNAMVTIAVDGERLTETCVDSITLPARGTAVIRMVAIVDGRYEFFDDPLWFPIRSAWIPGGVIVVDERRDLADLY